MILIMGVSTTRFLYTTDAWYKIVKMEEITFICHPKKACSVI